MEGCAQIHELGRTVVGGGSEAWAAVVGATEVLG